MESAEPDFIPGSQSSVVAENEFSQNESVSQPNVSCT